MLILILIFVLVTPASSMDLFNRFFGKRVDAVPRLPFTVIPEDPDITKAIQMSLDPTNDIDPVQFASWMSEIETSPKYEECLLDQTSTKKHQPFLNSVCLCDAPSETLLNSVEFAMPLKRGVTLRFEALNKQVNRENWAHIFKVLYLGGLERSQLLMFQYEMMEFLTRQTKCPTTLKDWRKKFDSISLDLIAVQSGFSKKGMAPDVLVKLKAGIENIGRTMGRSGVSPKKLISNIFRFDDGILPITTKNSLLRRFRLFAFAQITNGYLRSFPHRDRPIKLTAMVKRASPFFSLRDLQGFSLEYLIQEPKDTLEKIDKASRITPEQHHVFAEFVAPLSRLVSKNDLYGLRAFLSDFDIYSLDIEKEQRRLGLLQVALQDKPDEEIHGILGQLVENGFLPEGVLDIESVLMEAAHYEKYTPYDRLYGRTIEKVRDAKKGGAEPALWSKQKVLNQGLQLWLREYFSSFHKAAYIPRNAYIVEYEGMLEGEMMESGAEVTEAQAEITSNHMAAYTMTNELKAIAFPEVRAGQKAVFKLASSGAKIELVNEDDNEVISTQDLDSRIYGDQFDWISEIMGQYGINPNVLPAGVKKMTVPSEIPSKSHYAIRGGAGISEEQMVKSRGQVIDTLIRRGRISRSLKLPILLYLYGW
ncbi:MAG: hypothetical protein K2Q34_01680 [Alphaproteobacteria bacterium]|nr:hypothetical protein [Alphaproteobacteria bacterium]